MSEPTGAPGTSEPSAELTRLLELARKDIPAGKTWEAFSAKIVATASSGGYEPGGYEPGADSPADPSSSAGDGGGVTHGTATTSGTATSGTATSGTATSGTATSGTATSGTATSGTATSGTATSGTATSGTATSGTATSGTATSGTATSGTATTKGAGAVELGSQTLLSGAALKAVGAVVLAGSLGTAAWYQWAERGHEVTPTVKQEASSPQSPSQSPSHSPSHSPSQPPAVAASVELPERSAIEPELGTLAEGTGAEHAPPSDVATSRERAGTRVAPPSELSLLARARQSLASNPERSLALCRRHAQLYPQGQLAQEREVLLIEALQRLKRDEEAAQRRQEFGKSYPDSPHQSRVKPQQR
jgi:hypothetical protein